ncbi:hypothetical protein [Crocosphaera sp. XPORK-15E]|uniref:hypothetical protein n=1 Tax=Crocosphaera sp. XPORK-15E TaxID=3110247 RepID=UPI002B213A49|nr:hypothetical protein [Crocosphaera sp. XPORK-15E]MEA5534422.1 hypothetical protein [Crocosphaera sp. XPORK-15E]
MSNSSFFTDSQKQFNESNQKLLKLWEESQTELFESQQKLIYKLIDSMDGGTSQTSFPESLEKALDFQRELINSSLNAQQVTAHLAIETQKQLWDSFFQMTKKTA